MITDINGWHAVGRLTRDPELKYTNTGKPVLNFSIAVNDGYKSDGQEHNHASFFDCRLWGKYGETMAQYLTKGQQVCVEGKPRQETWEQNGQNRSKIVFIIDNLEMVGGKKDGAPTAGNSGAGNANSSAGDDFQDDIPF